MSTTHKLRRRRSAVAVIGIFLLSLLPASPVAANSAAQTPPFGQDWHDTTLINDVDDWSGVPGFVGYLGRTSRPRPASIRRPC